MRRGKLIYHGCMAVVGVILFLVMIAYALVAQHHDEWDKAAFYIGFAILMWLMSNESERKFDEESSRGTSTTATT